MEKSISMKRAFLSTALLLALSQPLTSQTSTTITGLTITPSDVVAGSTSAVHGTVSIQRGTDDKGNVLTGPVGYEIPNGGFDVIGYQRLSCDFQIPAAGGGFDCAVPPGATSGNFTLVPDVYTADVNLPIEVHLAGISALQPGLFATSPITLRAQRMILKLTPSTVQDGVPTQVTATVTFLAPPAPNIEDDSLPPALLDPVFSPLNAVESLKVEMLGSKFAVHLSPEFVDLNIFGIPPFALLGGQAGSNQFTKKFTITASNVTQVPFRAKLPVTEPFCFGCLLTANATLTVGTQQQQFLIKLGTDSTGPSFTREFDANTDSIPNAFAAKLGQKFPVEIVPLNADGTTGEFLTVTEEISDAKRDTSSQGPSVSGRITTLFKDNVLLHFAQTTTEIHHDFFPIHSGTANLKLTFTSSGTTHTVTLPVKITNCNGNDCTPQLGSTHPDFDSLFMKFADRNGVPPQLLKAQVAEESNFVPTSFRYEPLSVDFGQLAVPRRGTAFGALQATSVRPWALGQSSDCNTVTVAQGARLDLASIDATSRQKYNLAHDAQGVALCRVTAAAQVTNPQAITPTDTLPSMENVFFTNNSGSGNGWLAVATNAHSPTPQRFFDYLLNHPPFTSQTVIASSYGLHQLMYQTAIGEGYRDTAGVGLSPGDLFMPSTSLDLGTQYVALQFRSSGRGGLVTGANEAVDYSDEQDFLSQFGPALRGFNAGSADFTVAQAKSACFGNASTTVNTSQGPKTVLVRNSAQFKYACTALRNSSGFDPVALGGN